MTYPRVLTEEATLRAALAGRSIGRFGDGELKIAHGRNAKSQRYDSSLSAVFRRMLKDTEGPCLPCIPRIRPRGPKAQFWEQYEGAPYTWLYNLKGTYGSAFVTRPDSAPVIDTPEYWSLVRLLWECQDVVLVRGGEKSLTSDRLEGAASVHEIIGPTQQAWAIHRELFQKLARERRRVLLCLGATATALAWMLAQEGVHAVDLGHVGMFMKRIGPDGRVGPRRMEKD